MEVYNYKVTVFTPSYNRGYLLPRLYDSLKRQTVKNFEWLIVDDGSTDATEQIVESILKNTNIPIRYYKQPNGGKHRAINFALTKAQGELFFIADSDDKLTITAIETVLSYYKQVENDDRFCGVCGLDVYDDGTIVGDSFPSPVIDSNNIEIESVYGLTADKKEVFRTRVLQDYPFPEIENENFCAESLIWNRIAQNYLTRYFNIPIYVVEYLEGGLSFNAIKNRMCSPITAATLYSELITYNISFSRKIRAAINYWRFVYCIKNYSKIPTIKWYWSIFKPLSYIIHCKDIYNSNLLLSNKKFM